MTAASAHDDVMFIEVAHPNGVSHFLIELPNAQPVGWIAYSKDEDNWSVHVCPPGKFIATQNRFTRREDAERWVRSIASRGFD